MSRRITPAQRALLERKLRQRGTASGERKSGIPRRRSGAEDGPRPLSSGQERLLFLERLEPGLGVYHVGRRLLLRGPLRPAAVLDAAADLVRRHEALRIRFEIRSAPDGGERAMQVVLPPESARLNLPPWVDLTGLGPADRCRQRRRLAQDATRRPFDLARGRVVRTPLLEAAPEDHELVLAIHHVAADGASLAVLLDDLRSLYADFAAGRPGSAEEPPVGFVDASLWQRERLDPVRRDELLSQARLHLRGLPRVLELPADRPRPVASRRRGGRRTRRLPAGSGPAVEAWARELRTTPFTVLLTIFAQLLERLTGRRRMIVGTPVAGRDHPDLARVVGFFVRTLPVGIDLGDGRDPVERRVERVRRAVGEAFAFQDLPLEHLVKELAPERDPHRSPLFQVMFVLQEDPTRGMRWPGVEATLGEVDSGRAAFDLIFEIAKEGDGLSAKTVYAAERFDGTAAERWLRGYEQLLAAALETPQGAADALPLLTPDQAHQVLVEWARPEASPAAGTLPELLRAQVEARPDAVAVSGDGVHLSYGDLDRRTRRLAVRLAAAGAGPETAVAVVLDRSVELITALVAILRAGSFYLPVDPELPAARRELLAADGEARLAVTTADRRDRVPSGLEIVRVDGPLPPEASPGDAVDRLPGPDALAYVCHTSGSTGRPKGVAVPHRGVVRLVRGAGSYAPLGPDQVVLQLAPVSFDAATLEIWGALGTGARLEVAPAGPLSVLEVGRSVERAGVTVLWLTAGLFHEMVDAGLPGLGGLRRLLAGGDVLSPARVRRTLEELGSQRPDFRLVDGYGPTENTTFTCCQVLAPGEDVPEPVPVGRPVAGTRVHLLDSRGRPVPPGVVGGLYAGGDGLARGYRGRPARTARAFVPDPVGGEPGARLYRTGDLARWLPDGRVDFLGRADDQVKIRGFRIELGEVEAALEALPEVRRAAVTVRGDDVGDKRLAAYLVLSESASDDESTALAAVGSGLAGRLPAYMVPSAFQVLDELPLSRHGKVDRRALPAPGGRETAAAPRAPDTPTEAAVANLFRRLLHLEPDAEIGPDADFFALGGHSLLAGRLVLEARRAFGVELPLAAVFGGPTVRQVAFRIEAETGVEKPESTSRSPSAPAVSKARSAGPAPASFGQERLYFLDRLEADPGLYHVPLALRLRGPLDLSVLLAALRDVVAHQEVLRTALVPMEAMEAMEAVEETGAAAEADPDRWPEGVRVAQVVAPEDLALPWSLDDLPGVPARRRDAEIARRARREMDEPFDLAAAPLFRIALLRFDEDDHGLVLDVHHALADGVSLGIFLRDLDAAYAARRAGGPPRFAAPETFYGDWARQQRRRLSGDALEERLTWWRERLAGAPPALDLPTDRPRGEVGDPRGAQIPWRLDAARWAALERLGAQARATPFMVLLAAFTALLGRWAGQDDISVGTPVAGRDAPETADRMGFFVQTLVLRTDLSGDPSFRDLLTRARETALGAFAHQDVPFEALVSELAPTRDLARTPLFQVLLSLLDEPTEGASLDDVEVRSVPVDPGRSKFDLGLALTRTADGLAGVLQYRTALFDRATMESFLAAWDRTLDVVTDDPNLRLSELPAPPVPSAKIEDARPVAAETQVPEAEPPRDLTEEVAALWCRVLGVERVDPDASFFDLGGHSLLLIEVQRGLRTRLGREVEVVDLFRAPTVRSLARFLAAEEQPSAERALTGAPAVRSGAAAGEIAVVAAAGRFPGAASVDELWERLRRGDELVERVGEARPDDPSWVPVRGVLDDADRFDADFFALSPGEARVLDPQHRLFLECSWQVLEAAGVDPRRFPGHIGVFAGAGPSRHAFDLMGDPELSRRLGPFAASLGWRTDFLPVRAAYALGLTGPSINVQTACSTSLVAVHLACRSLACGESDLALAGGVAVDALDPQGYRHDPGGIASPDGHTRAFDAQAGGTVPGQGVGLVALRRLEDARADGHRILAVIRGTAVDNDGADRVGFTAPGVDGQERVITAALAAAGVDPDTVGYVEAHGTGTPLGDPVEVSALTRAFRRHTDRRGFCRLGSIKTNLGHLDAAAGVTGLIKAALALDRREIPPSLHFTEPNPRIDFGTSPFRVVTELTPWEGNDDAGGDGIPRRAGVSSFGIGGTNAHAILEEAPPEPDAPPIPAERRARLLVLSARTPGALEAASVQLAEHLEAPPEPERDDLADIAYTLQVGRRAFAHRRALVASTAAEATEILGAGLDATVAEGADEIAFLLPGQGAQVPGMASGLYRSEPVFRRELDRCAGILQMDLPRLLDDGRALDRTEVTQPVLFAVEWALARLLLAWGLSPKALLGHSLGEWTAAALAGVFSLEDALSLVALRGRLMGERPEGAMVAVAASEAVVEEVLGAPGAAWSEVEISAVNAPESVTVGGPAEAVDALVEELLRRGVEHRRLATSHAFHTVSMEPAVEPFTEAVARVEARPPRIPFVSGRTGSWVTTAEATDPRHWAEQIRHPVRFSAGVQELLRRVSGPLVEVGPRRSLAALVRRHGAGRERVVVPCMPKPGKGDDRAALLTALGRLWTLGIEPDWEAVHGDDHRHRVALPSYPFERRRFRLDEASEDRPEAGAPAERPAEPPETPTERAVARVWEELLGVSGVGRRDDFFELGGDSLMAVRLGARLRQALEREIPIHRLAEHSTVADLARLLDREDPGEPSADPRDLLVELVAGTGAAGDERPPWILLHPAGGHVHGLRDLAAALAADGAPVYGLRAPGLAPGETRLTTVEALAERHLEALEALREGREGGGVRWRLVGASLGGAVACEMARRLEARGETPAALVLLDTPGPGQLPDVPEDEELLRRHLPDDLDPEQETRLLAVARAGLEALRRYRPAPIPARALFCRARLRRPGDPTEPERPWIEILSGGVDLEVVPGDHETLYRGDLAAGLAETLREWASPLASAGALQK